MICVDGINQRSPQVEARMGDEEKKAILGAASLLLTDEFGLDVTPERLRRRAVTVAWMIDPSIFDGQDLGIVLERAGGNCGR